MVSADYNRGQSSFIHFNFKGEKRCVEMYGDEILYGCIMFINKVMTGYCMA
jgi:hypothetical protein